MELIVKNSLYCLIIRSRVDKENDKENDNRKR